MGRVYLCTGEYAKSPYYFENLGIRVFSAEELCYVLKENAFLLDREIIDRKLVKWIEDSLKLPKLAAALYPYLNQKTSVGAFAAIILQYVGFYDEDTVKLTEETFKKGANLNAYEKLKSRVDFMVTGGRYGEAIMEYNILLEQLPTGEKELTAKVYHNKGVAMCGLFMFDEAAEQFLLSYDLVPHIDTMVEYLAAKRINMEEGAYIAFAAGLPEYYDETLELEKKVEELHAEWKSGEEKKYLDERLSWKQEGDVVKYYSETDKKVQELKNRYRENVGN